MALEQKLTDVPSAAPDITAAIFAMQQEYIAAMQLAAQQGDMAKMQALALEMTTKLQALHGKPHLTVVPEVEPPLYDQNLCSVSLPDMVYDGDRDIFRGFLKDTAFMAAANGILEGAKPFNARKNLLKTALRLTPKLAPKVFETLQRCRQNLGLTGELEFYVCPDVQLNAFCYPPQDGKYIIGVTSSLLEKFDDDELAFVIGHEIGHALFNHSRFPAKFLLSNDESGHFSPLHAMKLFAWKRSAELSADRIGLVCSRNFDAAAKAFFKLSSGVTTNSLSFELREYINQFSDLSDAVGTEVDPEDWYSTHPFSPMRVKALDMFHRSETYLKLIGREGTAELSEEQLESEIKKVMNMMDPSYLSEGNDAALKMRDFVFLGGYLIAQANGVVEASEVQALGSLLDPVEVVTKLQAVTSVSADEHWKTVEALAKSLNITLPIVAKLNLIKDLTIIAGADGSVDESELAVLYRISETLNIRRVFVDHVLTSAAAAD